MPIFQSVKVSGGAGPSASINVLAGSTIVVVTTGGSGSLYTPTDNGGNTWPGSPAVNFDAAGARLAIWVLQNCAAKTGYQVTVASASGDAVFSVHEVRGVLAASLDSGATASGSGAEPYTLNAAGTLAQAANTVISAMLPYMSGDPVTYAANTGYTIAAQENNNNSFYGQGVASKSVSSTTAPSVQWDTTGATGDVFVGIIALKESGGAAYDLTVDPASYALTAAAETVTATRALTISPASYAITAAAVNLVVGRAVNFSPASYTLSAAGETLTATRALTIDPASYSLTNSPVTLSVGRVVSVDPVSYVLTAGPETLTVARALSVDPASYALTAANVTLEYASANPVLSVDPVSYTLTASDVTFEFTGGVQLLGGGPGGPRKRRKGGTESYLERLLGRPLDEEPEQEEIEAIEQAAEVAAKAPEPPKQEEAAESLREYGIALKDAYVQIYLELEQKKRQQIEEQEMMAVIAACF